MLCRKLINDLGVLGALSCALMVFSMIAPNPVAQAQDALELSAPAEVPPVPTAADVVDAPDLPEGAEVMVTGPLHEAFAEQFSDEPQPGIIIAKRPPELINEIPPEYRPAGEDIVWIPGYWGWDPDREDFLWITGIWRQAPPDRSWVPGYWAEVPEGFQWIAGFWSQNVTSEIRYLPPPPESLAADPSTPAPSEEHFWIPGQWSYVNESYQWRAGYWTMGYADWVWVPDRYIWTPSGCIYRAGYWDYLVPERGTVFCPVYWAQQPVVNYSFRPTYVVSTGPNLLANLFVYPRYHHYFFGNYYSSRNLGQTIYPWVTYGQQSRRYDPLYGYYHTHRRDNDYLNRITRLHNYYAANTRYQPPRTLTAQRQRLQDMDDRQDLNFYAVQLNKIVNNTNNIDHNMQLIRLADNERQRIQRGLEPAKEIWKQRAQFEVKSRTGSPDNQRDGRANRDARERRDGEPNQDNRLDARDRRWNLPQGQDGVRLGSIAVGENRARDNQTRDNQARDGQVRDGQVRDGQVRDGQVRDGQVRDGQVRDGQVRDGQVRDGQVRDGQVREGKPRDSQAGRNDEGKDRGPIGGTPNIRNKPEINPADPPRTGRDRPGVPGTAGDRPTPLDLKSFPGARDTNRGATGQSGEVNQAKPDTRSPLPGQMDQRNRDNTPRSSGGVPNNLPGSSPGIPGNSRTIPNNLPGTSPAIRPGANIPGGAKTPGVNIPGLKSPGANTTPGPANAGSNQRERERAPRINPTQPNNAQPKVNPPARNSIAPANPPKVNPPQPNNLSQPNTNRRAGSQPPANIQNDLQKLRENSQRQLQRRAETNNAPRRAPQPPGGGKPDKPDKPKDKN